jgi:putative membrane protein
MILPGISGSFLLLVFGIYFFIQNALKGLLTELVRGQIHFDALTYLVLFALGLIIGVAWFARVMSWLLQHAHDPTMGALVGLMAGSLRAVWPYRELQAGKPVNAWPHSLAGENGIALGAMACGILIILLLAWIDRRLQPGTRDAPVIEGNR